MSIGLAGAMALYASLLVSDFLINRETDGIV